MTKLMTEVTSEFASSPFLSSEQLEIEEHNRDGLIKALELLESGKLVLHPYFDIDPSQDGFNMVCLKETYECGTVACIAGWANHFGATFTTFPLGVSRA